MKLVPTFILLSITSGALVRGAEPLAPSPQPVPETAALATNQTPEPTALAAPLPAADTNAPLAQPENGALTNGNAAASMPDNGSANPEISMAPFPENGTKGLRLNFRGASLDTVLNYLSEAAGFIIVLEAQPRGRVDVWSSQPLTKDEAVDLLNTVLNKNGFAAIRRGRTLTIVNKDEAKTKDVPVHLGADPENIPETDEIVTQIIPVRYVEAAQLLKDLQPLVSTQTSMTANESGNSIVITDTQANIHRVAEVIKCIDSGAEDVTMVKVFHLRNSNPQEMADLITSLFPDDSRSSGPQAPFQFGGFRRMFGGRGGGPFGGGNQGGANGSQNQRIRKRNRVIAVADDRTSCVVVTAAKDLMDQIEGVVNELDADRQNVKTVAVIPLEHAEPADAMQVLQDIFQKSGSQNSRNQQQMLQNNALYNRSQQQNQQYNNSMRSSSMGQGTRRFGQ